MTAYDPEALGLSIKARRAALGLTQAELSELSGVGVKAIRNYETRGTSPYLETAARISEALGCTVDDLMRVPT